MVTPNSKMSVGRDKRDGSKEYKDRRSQFKVDHRHRKSEDGSKANKDGAPSKGNNSDMREKNTPKEGKEGRASKFEPVRERDSKHVKREEVSAELDKEDKEMEPKKFTGRCRLFVGNVPPETGEREFTNWFKPFGDCSEIFLNANRGFGFIRMDTRDNAEIAKKAMDGVLKRGRTLRVRFAAHVAAIRVKHLHPYVSNELLFDAFSLFGEIERAVVIIDDKGKSTGEGLVEYARKPGAMSALKRVNDGVFLLGSSPRPVVCELLEQKDEEDGMPEMFMSKHPDFQKERDEPPRFAPPGSFEYNFAQKWKQLYTHYEEQKKNVELQFQDAVTKMELEESNARMEHQTAMLREDLLRRQEELRQMEERHKMEMQRRMDQMHQHDDVKRKMDDDRRREDEARMFMQQEMAMRQMQQEERRGRGGQGDNAAPMQPPPAPPLGGQNNQRGGRNDVPSLLDMGQRMGQNEHGRPGNEMGQRGMAQQQPGMPMNPPQMGGMRQKRGDSDYRQSRFDQPPQQFPGNQQQMGGSPQMGNMMNPQNMPNSQMGNQQLGNPQMAGQLNAMGQQMGLQMGGLNPLAGQAMANMGNPMMSMANQMQGQNMGMQNMAGGNQGNMGGGGNPGRGKHMSDRQEEGGRDRDQYIEPKRSRRY